MNEIAATARLRLREFRRDDLDELAAMFGDPEQMRFYPRPRSHDETSDWLARNEASYTEHGYGFWRIEELETSLFLGYCGIRPLELDGRPATEIGWHTKKTSWNRGIATEAAKAVRDLAFTRHSRSELVALVPPAHVASRRVAEKIGMRETNAALFDGFEYVAYVCERGR
jgi:[ribosomal protein S5]-alanine N-acetyltransferase